MLLKYKNVLRVVHGEVLNPSSAQRKKKAVRYFKEVDIVLKMAPIYTEIGVSKSQP